MEKIVIILEGGLPQAIIATKPTDALLIDLDTEGAEECELMRVGQKKISAVVRMIEVSNDPGLAHEYFDTFDKSLQGGDESTP